MSHEEFTGEFQRHHHHDGFGCCCFFVSSCLFWQIPFSATTKHIRIGCRVAVSLHLVIMLRFLFWIINNCFCGYHPWGRFLSFTYMSILWNNWVGRFIIFLMHLYYSLATVTIPIHPKYLTVIMISIRLLIPRTSCIGFLIIALFLIILKSVLCRLDSIITHWYCNHIQWRKNSITNRCLYLNLILSTFFLNTDYCQRLVLGQSIYAHWTRNGIQFSSQNCPTFSRTNS